MSATAQPAEVQPGEFQPGEGTEEDALAAEEAGGWEGDVSIIESYYCVWDDQDELP